MELVVVAAESETDDMDPFQTQTRTRTRTRTRTTHYPVRTRAFHFDGAGNYHPKEFDVFHISDDVTTASAKSRGVTDSNGGFDWYHVELPKSSLKLATSAQSLITVLCPPLKLQDILTLASNGPFCGNVNGALIFRINSSGPPMSDFTLRIAARVTENSLVTVSLGRFPRLGFSPAGKSLLSDVPRVEEGEDEVEEGVVIGEHLLESLLAMNHNVEGGDGPVPMRVSDLLVHILDTHVDQVQDFVTNMEMELDGVELELDRAGSALRKQMLDDRRFPKMNLNLQRLLQVVAHGEQVFPRVKEKCVAKSWFASENIAALEELIGRLRRLKENLGFIVNRVTAVQAGLDSWQAEQINKKLYYLSFLSMVFLPLSIVTGVFGMNVGGVPWTGLKDPNRNNGFLNVMLICAAMVFLLLLCFGFPYLYSCASAWRRQRTFSRSWSLTRKPLRRSYKSLEGGNYVRI